MTSPSQEYLVVSRRDQPTELHLSDGTVAFLEPRGTLSLPAAVRDSPQLLALERQHAVLVRPAEAQEPHAEGEAHEDESARGHRAGSRWKRRK